MKRRELEVRVGPSSGSVSALLVRPDEATSLAVLAHGAGAGMRHPFLEGMATRLAARAIASFRFQFPYAERGGRRPDPPAVLMAAVRAALSEAATAAPNLTLLAGGKSLGGRMVSHVAAEGSPVPLAGLVFLGFPLHAPGRPSLERADHLDAVALPMLFLQGTRDALADLAGIRAVCARLGSRATLHVVEGADHSFRVPRAAGRDGEGVLDELADVIRDWHPAGRAPGSSRR